MKTFLIILCFLIIQNAFGQSDSYTNDSIQVEGQYVHFYEKGSGQPVLYIPGGPGQSSGYMQQMAEPITGYRNIFVDFRGVGKSIDKAPDPSWVSLNQVLTDLEAVRKKLKIQKWTVVGHSFGGQVAQYYAIKKPEVLNKIILIAPAPLHNRFWKHYSETLNMRLLPDDYTEMHAVQTDSTLSQHDKMVKMALVQMRSAFYDRKNAAEFLKQIKQPYTEENIGSFRYQAAIFSNEDYNKDRTAEVEKISIPVRIIMPRQDALNDGEMLLLNSKLKNSKIYYVERSGHFAWAENADDYYKVLKISLSD
ncbi:MAG: alpha/beta hydrolase [Flavobacteriaceae bacterium]|nr:alpha/beta hydrolase [Flavobacteriaceae bacterium]